jgi:invasion protein IalB
MSILFPRSAAVALAGALLLVGASAQAQQAPAAGGAPAQQPAQAQPAGPIVANLQAVQPDWTKVCGVDQASKKEICYTTRDFGAAAKEGDAPQPLLALAVYDPKADDNKIIRLLLPPGLMLKPGFSMSPGGSSRRMILVSSALGS